MSEREKQADLLNHNDLLAGLLAIDSAASQNPAGTKSPKPELDLAAGVPQGEPVFVQYSATGTREPRPGLHPIDVPIVASRKKDRRYAIAPDQRLRDNPEMQQLLDELIVDPETTKAVIMGMAQPAVMALIDVIKFAKTARQAAPGYTFEGGTQRRLDSVAEAIDDTLDAWEHDPRRLIHSFSDSFDPTTGSLQGLVFSANAGDHLTRAILERDPKAGAMYLEALSHFLHGDYVESSAMDQMAGWLQQKGIKIANPIPTMTLAANVMNQMGIKITDQEFAYALVGRTAWELNAYLAASFRLEEQRPKLVASKRRQFETVDRSMQLTSQQLQNIEALLHGTDAQGQVLGVHANYVVVDIPFVGEKAFLLPEALRGRLRLRGEEMDAAYQSPNKIGHTGDGVARGLLPAVRSITADLSSGISEQIIIARQLDEVRQAIERKANMEEKAQKAFEVVPLADRSRYTEKQLADLRTERWQALLRIFDLRTRQYDAQGDQDRAELAVQHISRQMVQDLVDWQMTQDGLTLMDRVIHTNQEAVRQICSAISMSTQIARRQTLEAQAAWLDQGMARVHEAQVKFQQDARQTTAQIRASRSTAEALAEEQIAQLTAELEGRKMFFQGEKVPNAPKGHTDMTVQTGTTKMETTVPAVEQSISGVPTDRAARWPKISATSPELVAQADLSNPGVVELLNNFELNS